MKRKYLFFDGDGTLTTGGYGVDMVIPESVHEALRKLREAGHMVFLSTGRSHALAQEFMDAFDIRNAVTDGGYGLTVDGELLGVTPMPHDKMVALCRECDEKGIPWGIVIDDTPTRYTPDGRFLEFTHDTYMETVVVPGLDPNDYENIYKANIACYYPTENTIETLKDLSGGRFHKEYIFVEPADKGYGIKQFQKLFDIKDEDVYVFGDAANDASMFYPEWTKVAMGNAAESLKELADYIAPRHDEDGIYRICEQLGLFED